MRLTQEGYTVEDHEQVFEVLWRYINDECSTAEPHKTTPIEVPKGIAIWKKEWKCQDWCNRLNAEYQKYLNNMVNQSK